MAKKLVNSMLLKAVIMALGMFAILSLLFGIVYFLLVYASPTITASFGLLVILGLLTCSAHNFLEEQEKEKRKKNVTRKTK